MKPHLTLAHHYWKYHVQPGDRVIDATMGNGHDLFFLAQLLQGQGQVIGYDIQPEALAQTQKRLEKLPGNWRSIVELRLQSHETFFETGIKLIVYNLGYLPGGNKAFTTLAESTIQSLQNGMKSLSDQGAISITCYPGHEEGAREQILILDFLKTLSSQHWDICHHVWVNRPAAPTWIWIRALPHA